MPKVIPGYKDQVKDRIVQEAFKVFRERGYHFTKMTDIAAKVNCSKGTLYQYFKSKDELFAAAFSYRIKLRQDQLLSLLKNDLTFFATEEFFLELYNSMTNSLRFSFDVLNLTKENLQLYEKLTVRNEDALSRLLNFFEEQKNEGKVRNEVDSRLIAMMFLGLRDGIVSVPSYGFDLEAAKKSWVLLAQKFLEIILIPPSSGK